MVKLIVNYRNFAIVAEFSGRKEALWSNTPSLNRHYVIRVRNKALKPAKGFQFDFWTSIAYPEFRSSCEVLEAFHCFVSDALSYLDARDTDDFANEFGYTKISEAVRIYKACASSWNKCKRVIGEEDDVRELYNALVADIDRLSAGESLEKINEEFENERSEDFAKQTKDGNLRLLSE